MLRLKDGVPNELILEERCARFRLAVCIANSTKGGRISGLYQNAYSIIFNSHPETLGGQYLTKIFLI